jgi:ribosomal protein S18 acetylase RimI-like enzyme
MDDALAPDPPPRNAHPPPIPWIHRFRSMTMTDSAGLTIRRATLADAPAVAELARRTFMDAFAAESDPHDRALHAARTYGVPQQAAEIAHPGIITLLAEVAGHPAAYAQIRHVTPPSCVPDADAVEISRFYVDQAWHGRGIAQRLMHAALSEARGMGARTAWLMTYEHNHRALAYYAKEGFREVGRHGYLFGNTMDLDRVLVRDLTDVADGGG